MVSPYLTNPLRTKREAEIDKLCLDLKDDHRFDKTDGHLQSVRRLLEYAEECVKQHRDSLPMSEHAYDNAVALYDALDNLAADYFLPAEESAREYFDREDVG